MKKINYPILALIIANLIWGASFPILKLSLENIPPLSLAFIRFLIAAVILYPFVHRSTQYSDLKNKWLWVYALAGITVNILFFFLALQKTTALDSTIIASSGPVMILIGSGIFLREKVKKKAVIGTLFALAGVLLIIIQPILAREPNSQILGNLLMVMATLGSVVSTIAGRKFLTAKNAVGMTFWSCFIGMLTFLPFLFTEFFADPGWIARIDYRGIIGIVYASLLSTVVAYTAYDWALAKVSAYRTSVFTYIDPIASVALAIPLLGEKITLPFIAGTILVFGGVFIAERRVQYHPLHLLFKSGKI